MVRFDSNFIIPFKSLFIQPVKRHAAFVLGGILALMGWSGMVHAADPGNGGKIYATHCSNCHGEDGTSTMPGTPDFSRRERLFKPDMALLVSIRDGISVMPAYKGLLTDQEILDIVAYLRTLR